jgi:hypothetical protein
MTTHKHRRTKVVILGVLLIMLWGIMHAANVSSGTYSNTAHGNRLSGADRSVIDGVDEPYSTEIPRGHCPHCHEPPGACDWQSNLFMANYGENKNELCYACHETFNFGYGLGWGRYGFYQGKDRYTNSTHNTSPSMMMTWPDALFPGPAVSDAGNCNNCHTPHGYDDGSGLIPHMLFQRDGEAGNEMGCYSCHGENPAAGTYNIKAEATKTYRHPIGDYDGRHAVDESGTTAFGPDNRHAECVDCHNPHTVGSGSLIWGSDALYGVWGVMPSWWPALDGMEIASWTEWKPPAYPNGAEYEGQICLKCHSNYGGWSEEFFDYTTRDIAREINPNNLSGHPIAGTQNDSARPPLEAWAEINPPWAYNVGNTHMLCTDCHGNDAGVRPKGVHGSSKPHMLKAEPGTDRHYWIKTDTDQWFRLNNRDAQWHIDKLFCLNCHTVANDNLAHSGSWHQDYACTHCHSQNIHGGSFYGMAGQRLTTFSAGGWGYRVDEPCHPTCGK